MLVLLLIRREEEATHPGAEEEEERVVLKFFPVVVVVVDLMIIILFLVCRVAQKQLLDAILIIAEQNKVVVVFTLVSSLKKDLRREVWVYFVYKKWERKKERKMKTTREKVKEGKIRFQKQKVLALFSHAKKTSRRAKVFGFLSFKSSFSFRGFSRKTPHNTTQ